MSPKDLTIAVSATSFCKNQSLVQKLSKLGPKVVLNNELLSEDGLVDFVNQNQASILLVGREPITSRGLENMPHLQMVAKYGVGTDNLDLEALQSKKISVGLSPGTNAFAVAELALGFLIGSERNLFQTTSQMRSGVWNKDGGRSLRSRHIGLVGFGNVGGALAKLLGPFQCRISATDILPIENRAASLGVEVTSYAEILAHCDVISFHVPLTNLTRGMFDRSAIERCAKQPLIINTARGALVNEEDVYRGIKTEQLSGYCADVFAEEPFDQSKQPLNHMHCTPHIGGNSHEAVLAMGEAAIQCIATYLERPANN